MSAGVPQQRGIGIECGHATEENPLGTIALIYTHATGRIVPYSYIILLAEKV